MLLYITLYTIESYAIMDFIDTCVCASIVSKPMCKRCLSENGLCMESGKHWNNFLLLLHWVSQLGLRFVKLHF